MHGTPSTTDGAAAGTGATDPELSVVVVTYEEAERIGDCLASIFAACRGHTSFEVLLVDSNSTDETVAVASDYDVTIHRITDDDLTTPAAGRYVGTQRARGERVLFVDGDVTLTDGEWLTEALTALREDPDLAGVSGHLNERRADEAAGVDFLHGVALYDREALSSVGGFHPFLAAWEDVDLGFQLTLAGYELRRLPVVVGHHPLPDSSLDQLRRWRQGYYRAGGQVCSKALTRPALLGRWLWYFRDKVVATGWLGLGVALAVVQPLAVLGWLLATVASVGALCARLGRQGGFRRTISAVLFPLGFVLGFETIPDREAFPDAAVETLQTGSVYGAEATAEASATD